MIDILKRLSPASIEFMSRMSVSDCEGMFSYGDKYIGHPLGKIEILDSLLLHEKIATLAHEIGHALCYEKRCKCLQPETVKKNYALAEIHAYKYVLSWLLKNKQKQALIWEMGRIKENSLNPYAGHYREATKHIMKLKLWQKCLNYVNNP